MYVFVCMYMHECSVYTHEYIYINLYIYILYIDLHIYCIYIYTHTYIHIYMYVYIYTHIYSNLYISHPKIRSVIPWVNCQEAGVVHIHMTAKTLSCSNCIAGIEKQLYYLPQPQNNCTEKPTHIGNPVNCIEVQLGGVKPSWDC